MEVKGTAYLARKDMIIRKFGQDKWIEFLTDVSEKLPYFKKAFIMTSSLIPAQEFISFQEELNKQFFDGKDEAYWKAGAESAEFALVQGPYKGFMMNKDIKDFVERSFPQIWNAYYTEGKVESRWENNVATVKIFGTDLNHVYYEYLVMGFLKKALELLGARITNVKKIKGPSSGDTEVHYELISI